MTNKAIGNKFESELCEFLSQYGFWAHNFAQNQDGQPADIIAVKNKKAYLIDCKVCSTKKGFDLARIEDNQNLSMELWKECGNGVGWFAIKMCDRIYMLSDYMINSFFSSRKFLSFTEIQKYCTDLESWVKCR